MKPTTDENTSGYKIIAVVKSCKSIPQLETAKRMIENFHKLYGKSGAFDMLVQMKERSLYA